MQLKQDYFPFYVKSPMKTNYNLFFSSNTSITFMKYSLGYMFRPQLGHHQALYMYRSFILQYIFVIPNCFYKMLL